MAGDSLLLEKRCFQCDSVDPCNDCLQGVFQAPTSNDLQLTGET
ncbi:hypothetical protein Nmel_000569, partial [Mimus melanotis]